MFSSPTESSTKAKRSNSHTDGQVASGSSRSQGTRQLLAITSTPNDEISTSILLSGRTSDRSIKWHWIQGYDDSIQNRRRFHSSVVINTQIFIFGGEQYGDNSDEQEILPGKKKIKILLNDLIAFDVVSQVWRSALPGGKGVHLPPPRKGHTLSVWGSKLILFGGGSHQTYLNDVWIYDTQLNQSDTILPNGYQTSNIDILPISSEWKQIYPAAILRYRDELFGDLEKKGPLPRAYHTAVVYKDSFYVYGGYGFSHELQDEEIWKLDLHTNQWTPINSISSLTKPGRRYGHIACCFDDSMFIFGGQLRRCLNDNNVYRFSFTTREWTLSPMKKRSSNTTPTSRTLPHLSEAPCPRTYHSGALLESHGRWLIHGGSNEDKTFGDLYEFNILNERWRSIPCPTPIAVEGHTLSLASTGVSYALISIGGCTNLVSQALRLDLMSPSISMALWKFEELIVPSFCVMPFLEYIKQTSETLMEVKSLRLARKAIEQEKSRATIDTLSAENENLRLQLQEIMNKLEMKETQYKEIQHKKEAVNPSLWKSQLKEKQNVIDKLSNETQKFQDSIQKSETTINEISETLNQLRDKATTIAIASSSEIPLSTAVKIASITANLILQIVDQAQEKLLNNDQNSIINPETTDGTILRNTEHRSTEQLSVKRTSTQSEISPTQNHESRSSSGKPYPGQHQSDHVQLNNSTTTESSTSSRIIHPGVDVVVQAGKGNIKLFHSSRKRSINNSDQLNTAKFIGLSN